MGDLVLRISLMVQRGYICSVCGQEIDGQYSETVRECSDCCIDEDHESASSTVVQSKAQDAKIDSASDCQSVSSP